MDIFDILQMNPKKRYIIKDILSDIDNISSVVTGKGVSLDIEIFKKYMREMSNYPIIHTNYIENHRYRMNVHFSNGRIITISIGSDGKYLGYPTPMSGVSTWYYHPDRGTLPLYEYIQ